MKRINQKIVLILCLCISSVHAQKRIEVSPSKTAYLIFQEPIKQVIGGGNDFFSNTVYDKTNTVAINTLQVEEGKAVESNIAVYTKSDKVYQFNLYNVPYTRNNIYQMSLEEGTQLHVKGADTVVEPTASYYSDSVTPSHLTTQEIQPTHLTSEEIKTYCKKYSKVDSRYSEYTSKGSVNLTLNEVSHYKDQLFFHFVIQNKGVSTFDIDFIDFKRATIRKTVNANAEQLLKPTFTYDLPKKIAAKSKHYFVVAFEKFTLNKGYVVEVNVGEKEGGRNLILKTKHRKVNQPKVFEK